MTLKPQIPSTPTGHDATTVRWFSAIGQILKDAMGKGAGRFITAQELIDSGIATGGSGGAIKPITSTKPNLTTPPTVAGLTAQGAFALVILHWGNVAALYANHAYVEIWRADVDDVGQAVKIGTSQTLFYNDAIGTGARKYYWVRAVSTSGVTGPFSNSVVGQTSYDVSYVMDLLTSTPWQPNTVYQPYQYVQPTIANGFVYLCIDGGLSGIAEPTWPVVVGQVIGDADIVWRCRPDGEKVPFGIGLVDGLMSVVINKAYIADASIESAKIKNLVADKITAGRLSAGQDIEVGSHIWSGFSDFFNVGAVAGWWMGMIGGVPHLKISTNNNEKYIQFDGNTLEMNVDVVSSADGSFDDLNVDSLKANRSYASVVSALSYVEPSDAAGAVDSPDYNNFICYSGELFRLIYSETVIPVGHPFPNTQLLSTALHNGIIPYNESNPINYNRFPQKKIAMRIRYGVSVYTESSGSLPNSIVEAHQLRLHDENDVMIAYCDVPIVDRTMLSAPTYSQDCVFNVVSGGSFVAKFKTDAQSIDGSSYDSGSEITTTSHEISGRMLFIIESDQEMLQYTSGRRIRASLYCPYYDVNGTITTIRGLAFQLWKKPRVSPSFDSLPLTIDPRS